jgi:predicted negative regulator of RcsB-dependent stress response
LIVAVLFAAGAVAGWTAVGSTQETATLDRSAFFDDLATILNEKALEQHAQTVEHMERVEDAQEAHEDRMADALGDRAPTETIAPVATIAPVETVPPAG